MLRARWVTVCVTALIVCLDALAFTLTTTPQYQAATRLYVSASSGSSIQDLYRGNQLSQERLLSYTQLIMSSTLAQRTVDHRNLEISADSLRAKVVATAERNTVLINVSVVDPSPTRARDLVNAVSDEFSLLAPEFDPPLNGRARQDIRIVVEQRASVPTKPIAPNKRRNLLYGLAAGIALGMGLAIFRDLMDNAVKDRENLEAITGVGLVGSIPLAKELRKTQPISFEGNRTSVAESFRKLRTNLQFLNVDHPPRVIVVTSASPGEGKTTTAINIALALAEAEHNVVLVDADLRRPSVHKCLGLAGGAGLSTVLSGAAALPEVLQEAKSPNLTVLTSGVCPPNPSELLGSRAAKNVLKDLRERFDLVIVDSPPLLAVTDSSILSANSDGALIVCRYGRTKQAHLANAIGVLKDVGANVLGAALTMTPARSRTSTYDGSYYYSDPRETVGS